MINKFDIKLLVLLSIFPIIFYFITFNNYFYSDDYQLIIGIHLFNKINDQYFINFRDLLTLRSDGHFTPIMYYINNILPPNHKIFHTFIVFIFLISTYLTYFFLKLFDFDRRYCFFSALFFSLNISLLIKPLVWNTFHSHITNYFTAIISFIFFYSLIRYKKKYISIVFFILFGSLTVFNSESGLIYYVILPFLFYFFFKKKLKVRYYVITLIPIFLYLSAVFFISFKDNQENILVKRVLNEDTGLKEEIIKDYNLKQKISYLRSRKSPRNFEGKLVVGVDMIIASLNLGSYEYILRYLDKKKLNFLAYLTILVFILSTIFYLYLFIKYILLKKNIKNNDFLKHFFLLFTIFIIYLFVYQRKDINICLSLVVGLCFSYIYLYILKLNIIRKLLIFTFFLPTLAYASTGFDEVYEMRERKYIENMYEDFISLNKNDIVKLREFHYSADLIYLFFYNNFQHYSDYLNKYKGYTWFEFETILMNDTYLKINK